MLVNETTEKKLTEAEIMKALECCSTNVTNKHYMLTYKGESLSILFEAVIDLINRKNAETEEYKKRFEMLDSNSQMAIGYADALEERARAEAIKEVLQRVKKQGWHSYDSHGTFLHINEELLDQIAKEMGVEL